MNITEFLLARIAEDEAVARDVNPDARAEALDGMTSEHYETWRFLLEQTPTRVLAECEAKRRIVNGDTDDDVDGGYADGVWGERQRVLRALAAVYADHPDYDPAWRP